METKRYETNTRDRLVHKLANLVLRMATTEYRSLLRSTIVVGRVAMSDEAIFEEVLERINGNG